MTKGLTECITGYIYKSELLLPNEIHDLPDHSEIFMDVELVLSDLF